MKRRLFLLFLFVSVFIPCLRAQTNTPAALLEKGESFMESNDFEKAEESFLAITNDSISPTPILFKAEYNLCMLYLLTDNISSSLLHGEHARELVHSQLGLNSDENLAINELMALVYEMTGNTSRIIDCKKDVLDYYLTKNESPSSEVGFAQIDYAKSFLSDGDYVSGLDVLDQAKDTFLKLLADGGEQKRPVTESMLLYIDSDRLYCLSACGNKDDASLLYADLKERLNQTSETPREIRNSILLDVYNNLSTYCLTVDEPLEALTHTKKILACFEEDQALKENNIKGYLTSLWKTGFLQYMSDVEHNECCENIKKYLEISRELQDQQPLDEYDKLLFANKVLAYLGDPKVGEYLELLTQDSRDLVTTVFKELSKSEREHLWRSHFSNDEESYMSLKNIILSYRDQIKNDSVIYDYLLLSKGILLNSSINDNVLVARYGTNEEKELWKELLTNEKVLEDELRINPNSTTLDSLRARNVQIERLIHLNGTIERGISDYYNVNYQSLVSRLNDNDVVIDFASYINERTGVRSMAAYVFRKGMQTPLFVPLFDDTTTPYLVNIDARRIFSRDELQKQLFESTWGRLIQYINKKDTVYIIPDGYINNLPIEYLNQYLNFSKKNRLTTRRLSSSRSITNASDCILIRSAYIFGGIDYNSPNYTLLENKAENSSRSMMVVDSTSRGAGWSFLPYTVTETTSIHDILIKAGVDAHLYQGENGSEEAFKNEYQSSPTILHLATHGYYVSSRDALKVEPLPSELNERERVNYADFHEPILDYALVRSGLILAGGNNTWKNGEVSVSTNDGVLTAQEIANVNLNETELVVISACNSGLGDIKEDGVFGLQRAFKSAGANSVIMSLWPVDDEATSRLMSMFYRYLVKYGSKHKAFTKAVDELRSKYKDPYYWAAFIMLD